MPVSQELKALRQLKGLSQVQVAEYLTVHGCAVTQKAVSKWEVGGTQPNAEQFLLLCELYGVRDVLEAFCGHSGLFGFLNDVGRQRIREYARLLGSDASFSSTSTAAALAGRRMIRLYTLPASAGTGQFLDDASFDTIEAEADIPVDATYALRLSGDSMTPKFNDGQIVYVRQQETLDVGDIGIFSLNGAAFCKVLTTHRGRPALQSLNPKYAPILVGEADTLRIFGKVVR